MKKILLFSLLTVLSTAVVAQKGGGQVPINLPLLDKKTVHWGFTFGTMKTDFSIYKNKDFFNTDSVNIYGIESSSLPGLFLGPVFNLRLGKHFDLRFLIDISFTQRNLKYYIAESTDSSANIKQTDIKIPSSFIEVPVLLKFKGNRINNFRPYIIAGAAGKYDLASLRKIDENQANLKLAPFDFYMEIGPGFDFYFPFFKFSIELKYSNGFFNVLEPDNTIYSQPIDAFKSHSFMLSFHFEG